MSYLLHEKERGDTCELIEVGKNLQRNGVDEWIVPTVHIHTNTILLILYYLRNERMSDENRDTKDIGLDP